MIIDASNLTALRDSINTRFQAGFTAAQPWHPRVAMEVPSSTETNTYAWMAEIPKFREWVGERVAHGLKSRSAQIVNKKFEDTVRIPRDKLEDDQYGIYGNYAEMVGAQARKLPDDLLAALIIAAGSTVCYDGQYFFDTDHPINVDGDVSGTQANLITSKALSAANYGIARATLAGLKGEQGRVLGVQGNLLVVPPALESTARQILNAEIIGGETNIWRNTAELLVIPELAADSSTTWYLLDTSKPIKPFVWQNRSPAEFTAFFDPKDEHVFKFDEFLFGGRARGNVGFGLWFLALKATA